MSEQHTPPPAPVPAVPLDRQIACVKRELALRRTVYAKRVQEGKMSAEEARAEYDAMSAVLGTLGLVEAAREYVDAAATNIEDALHALYAAPA